jgi:hypothetical protein
MPMQAQWVRVDPYFVFFFFISISSISWRVSVTCGAPRWPGSTYMRLAFFFDPPVSPLLPIKSRAHLSLLMAFPDSLSDQKYKIEISGSHEYWIFEPLKLPSTLDYGYAVGCFSLSANCTIWNPKRIQWLFFLSCCWWPKSVWNTSWENLHRQAWVEKHLLFTWTRIQREQYISNSVSSRESCKTKGSSRVPNPDHPAALFLVTIFADLWCQEWRPFFLLETAKL